jgi:uncharacterized repeat protein (TIGR01451 family)
MGLVAGLASALLGGTLAPAHAGLARSAQASGVAKGAATIASLAITASVSPSSLTAGGFAVYTVTVQNKGNVDAPSVTTTLPFSPEGTLTVRSPLPTGCTPFGQTVTCTKATISVDQAVSYRILVKVLPGISDGTSIALRALASAPGLPSAGTDLTTQVSTQVDVGISKTGPASVIPGGTIHYTITVTNRGPSNAASVTWHDATNGNLTTITSYPCGNTGLTVTCSIGAMAPGASRTYHLTLAVNPNVTVGTIISDCAVAYTGTSPNIDPGNNQSCTNIAVRPPMSNIKIAQSSPTSVEQGGTIRYSVTTTNNGPDPATNVTVSDPVRVPFDSISTLPSDCSLQDGSTVTCTAKTLAVGKSKTFSFSVKLTTSVPAGTNIMSCAAVTSESTQVAQQPYPSCVQTQVVSVSTAAVRISTTGPVTVHSGGAISYRVRVTNDGPDAAENVVIRDPLNQSLVTVTSPPKGCSSAGGTVTCDVGTLAAGSTKVFTITARVSADAAANTVIRNCGSVDSITSNPNMTLTQSCVTTTITA